MIDKGLIDWESLELPEYEDPAATKVRLDAIHRQILEEKGISVRPSKNSPGFAPTPYQARQVAVMSALGLDPKDIALVLDVEEKMLALYYRKELRVSHNLANAMVARVALQMALSGRYPDMTKFWLKARGGWKEAAASTVPEDKGRKDDLDSAKERLKRLTSPPPVPKVKV
jgi:hypothetical protein